MSMLKGKSTGVAVITPFTNSGVVDYDALTRIIDFLIDAGIDFLVALGTTGESVTLTPDEKKEVFATFSFGWAVGKIVAASSSQKATKLFCQLNSLPMTYFVYCCHKAQTFDWPTWALFLTAYVYFGYLAK